MFAKISKIAAVAALVACVAAKPVPVHQGLGMFFLGSSSKINAHIYCCNSRPRILV